MLKGIQEIKGIQERSMAQNRYMLKRLLERSPDTGMLASGC